MMDRLKPHSHYKSTGHQWIGDIPDHWETMPNRALFSERKEKNHPDESMLSVTIKRGVIPQNALLADTSKKDSSNLDRSAYKLVTPGDVAYNKMRAWQGAVGASLLRGIVSPAYVVMQPRDAHFSQYFHYLYRTPLFAKEAERWSYGITSDMWSLRPEHFKMIYSPVPPAEEQAAIVRYLDWACGRLDRAIRAKRKIITLLNEQKQAIIHRAVTRGVVPHVPVGPSRASWLGDVPSGWSLRRAKFLFREVDERSASGSEELLSVSHITGVTPRSQKNITMFKAESYVGHKLCKPGDLVINTMWAWMGALGVSGDFGIVSPAYAVYRQRDEGILMSQFVDLLLRTKTYVDEFRRRSTGIRSSRLRMYPEEFFKIEILIPPYSEQENILRFIAARTATLDKSIEQVTAKLDLLHEYRTRLIADVVTGKLDVREAAAKLPAEVPLEPANDDLTEIDEPVEYEETEPVA